MNGALGGVEGMRNVHNILVTYNKNQQDALFLYFILVNNSTCFGQTVPSRSR